MLNQLVEAAGGADDQTSTGGVTSRLEAASRNYNGSMAEPMAGVGVYSRAL